MCSYRCRSASADPPFAAARSQEGAGFRVVCLFHRHIDVLQRALPTCVRALTEGTRQDVELTLHCDGTQPDVAAQVIARQTEWHLDEVRIRRREHEIASGDASNSGHRRLFGGRERYLVVVEDDVWMYRSDPSFDVLTESLRLFQACPDVTAICKLDDHDAWAWKLADAGPSLAPGVRSVNRVATHFIIYDLARFLPAAERFGAFDLDVFIDRDDFSYNWEDLVSHVATTGGRCIAWPERWPLHVYHCDRKTTAGSMYNTQDPQVKNAVIDELTERFPSAVAPQ